MENNRDSEVEFILRNFDLRRDEHVEIEGLRSLFRRVSQTIPFTNASLSSLSDTLQQAQYTMTLIQAHEKPFFGWKTPEKREAMIVTALLGEHSMNAESYTNDAYYRNLEPLARYIRHDISDIGLQVSVLLEAESIMDVPVLEHESFCLHIAALNKMREYKVCFSHLSAEQRKDAGENTRYLISQFSRGASEFSAYTCREVEKVQDWLRGSEKPAPSAEIIAFRGPKR